MQAIGEPKCAPRMTRPVDATIEDAGFLSAFLGEAIGEGPVLVLFPSGAGGLDFARFLGGLDCGP